MYFLSWWIGFKDSLRADPQKDGPVCTQEGDGTVRYLTVAEEWPGKDALGMQDDAGGNVGDDEAEGEQAACIVQDGKPDAGHGGGGNEQHQRQFDAEEKGGGFAPDAQGQDDDVLEARWVAAGTHIGDLVANPAMRWAPAAACPGMRGNVCAAAEQLRG